jgi:mono/diheme cytochrome c family protein
MFSKKLLIVLLLAAGCVWAQEEKKDAAPSTQTPTAAPAETPHPGTITDADKARKNPVKFTTFSTDRGKKSYNTQCALCHGDKGDGKGDLAKDMKLNLPDFTKAGVLDARTDGELFAIIGGWKDPMPPQAGRMTDVHRWYLVNYLRMLSGKVPEKATGNEPDENILLIPQPPIPATPATPPKK